MPKHLLLSAGNTSITERIGSRLGYHTDYESVSDYPYLPDFYRDLHSWSFHLQVLFLGHRAQQHLYMAADTEKITINMSHVDLGKVDLLVDEGFYANRTDFIRTAIRNLLGVHHDSVQHTVTRKSFVMGTIILDTLSLQKIRDAGERRSYSVIGLLVITPDVTPELAQTVIEKVTVRGVFRASDEVKDALADRIG